MILKSAGIKQEEIDEIPNKLNNVASTVCKLGYFTPGLAGLWVLRQNTRPLSPNRCLAAGSVVIQAVPSQRQVVKPARPGREQR